MKQCIRLSYNGADSDLPNQAQFVNEMQQATVDYQALSNDVVKIRTNYDENGEEINHILIKDNGETIVLHMKRENGYPKVVNQEALKATTSINVFWGILMMKSIKFL